MTHDGTPGGSGRIGTRTVARIGYGAMQLERFHDDRPSGAAVLERALEVGIDHFDTADFYGDGFVNDLVREVIAPHPEAVVVTKVGAVPDPGGRIPLRLAQKPDELRGAVEANLRGLGVDRLDVVNLRRTDVGPGVTAEGDQVVDLDDQLAVLTDLRAEGKIDAIGLSAVTGEILRRALPAGIVCVQNAYSLVSREHEELLSICETEGIAWVPFFPLGSAFPNAAKVVDQPAVREASSTLGVTASQVGLAWLLQHAPQTLLIPGTGSVDHLAENVAAGDIVLPPATMAALDEVAATQTPVDPTPR